MSDTNSNIIILADYLRARENLDLNKIEEIINYGQSELRGLDRTASAMFMEKHKLKSTEKLRKDLVEINTILLEISDWLDDEPINVGDSKKAEKIEKLRVLNNRLLARSEITRKVLVDAMAASRYYEQRWLLDPAKFIALVVVAPVGISTFVEKFITDKNHIGINLGEATVAVGLYLTFKTHADVAVRNTQKKIKKAPSSIRAFAAASALEMSVKTTPLSDIKPKFPKVRTGGETVMIELKR